FLYFEEYQFQYPRSVSDLGRTAPIIPITYLDLGVSHAVARFCGLWAWVALGGNPLSALARGAQPADAKHPSGWPFWAGPHPAQAKPLSLMQES
ncbi:MAG: hypothetical protein AAFQ98_16130, partial [Bacteroidota bacterium]